MSTPSYFDHPTSVHRLAYRYTPPLHNLPTVLFLSGFRSDMNGEKVMFLETLCGQQGVGFLTFDYFGHGFSSGNVEDGSISQWLSDSLTMMDHFTQGPVIVVGSSMGGWLAHLLALRRDHRIIGLLGIAAAPDFTEELMWQKFTPVQQTEVETQGWTIVPTEYTPKGWRITKKLIEDGRQHRLLKGPISLNIPIRLLHGVKDLNVPTAYSQRLLELTTSQDITLTLIKSGNHRLSRDEDKRILETLLKELITRAIPYK